MNPDNSLNRLVSPERGDFITDSNSATICLLPTELNLLCRLMNDMLHLYIITMCVSLNCFFIMLLATALN